MIAAIRKELELRKDELSGETIETIYFGGGTPSILNNKELEVLLQSIHWQFKVSQHPEITLEANPDDLSIEKLQLFKNFGINRLSIGLQTFNPENLKYINRAHDGQESHDCLKNAQAAGFENISADLIYALPNSDQNSWQSDLETLLSYDLAHISLYGLTVEEKTAFGNWYKKGKLKIVSEELAAAQYELAIETLKKHGYEHYEVSNFAKPGMYSRHNTAYWEDKKYLGVGPGAHSYDGLNRSYNISHNAKYIKALEQGQLALEIDELTPTDRMNEYIFTHLRTNKGIKRQGFMEKFGKDLFEDFGEILLDFSRRGLANYSDSHFVLTSRGFMIADEITWRLFYDA